METASAHILVFSGSSCVFTVCCAFREIQKGCLKGENRHVLKSMKCLISNSKRTPLCFTYRVPAFCTMLHNSILTGQGCIDPMSSAPRQAVEYFKPIQTIILHFVLPRSSPLTYICVAAELSTVYHRRWAVLIFITLQNTLFYYSVF